MPWRCVQCGQPKAPSQRHKECWEFQDTEQEFSNEYQPLYFMWTKEELKNDYQGFDGRTGD